MSIAPYLWISLFAQMLLVLSPLLSTFKRRGDAGLRALDRLARLMAILFAAWEGHRIAGSLEELGSFATNHRHMLDPAIGAYHVSLVIIAAGSTAFLIWLGDLITRHGLGNGIFLLYLSDQVVKLPEVLGKLLALRRVGTLSSDASNMVVIVTIAFVFVVVIAETASRRVPIRYRGRDQRAFSSICQTPGLTLRLNPAGIVPINVASWCAYLPERMTQGALFQDTGWRAWIHEHFQGDAPLRVAVYAALIFVFALVYTAFSASPEEIARRLRRYGGEIEELPPDGDPVRHLNWLMTFYAIVGAIYLVAVALLPEILLASYHLPFAFRGPLILLGIAACLDLMTQCCALAERRPSDPRASSMSGT
jgi:preprotein translocase subunit SecY